MVGNTHKAYKYRLVDALHDVNMLGLEGDYIAAILDRFGNISSYIVEMVIIEDNREK